MITGTSNWTSTVVYFLYMTINVAQHNVVRIHRYLTYITAFRAIFIFIAATMLNLSETKRNEVIG